MAQRKPRKNRLNSRTLKSAEIDYYADYLKGNHTHTVGRKLSADKLKRHVCGVVPFNLTGSDHVKTTITRAALDVLEVFSTIDAASIGLKKNSAEISGTLPGGKAFAPALWIPTVYKGDKAFVKGTSAFTGRKTKSLKARSGSIPFGKVVDAKVKDAKSKEAETAINLVDQEDVKASIEERQDKLIPDWSLATSTFVPEAIYKIDQGATEDAVNYKPAVPTM